MTKATENPLWRISLPRSVLPFVMSSEVERSRDISDHFSHPQPAKNDFLSIRSKMPFSLMKRFDISVLMTDELRAFLQGAHPDPFRILGPHRLRDDVLVRVFRPDAREVSIKLDQNG